MPGSEADEFFAGDWARASEHSSSAKRQDLKVIVGADELSGKFPIV
jgi:hypothetical protein